MYVWGGSVVVECVARGEEGGCLVYAAFSRCEAMLSHVPESMSCGMCHPVLLLCSVHPLSSFCPCPLSRFVCLLPEFVGSSDDNLLPPSHSRRCSMVHLFHSPVQFSHARAGQVAARAQAVKAKWVLKCEKCPGKGVRYVGVW